MKPEPDWITGNFISQENVQMTEYVEVLAKKHKNLVDQATVGLIWYRGIYPYSEIIKMVAISERYTFILNGLLNKAWQIYTYYPTVDIVALDALLTEITDADALSLHTETMNKLNGETPK